MSGITGVWRNGYKFSYDPVILADFRNLLLLTQGYTKDFGVTKQGEYITTMIRGSGGEVLYSVTARADRLIRDREVQFELITDNPGPYVMYIIMQWFYPGRGVFSYTFRASSRTNPTAGNSQPIVFSLNTASEAFRGHVREARAVLSKSLKNLARSKAPSSGGRPAHEQGNQVYRYYHYGSHFSPPVESWNSVYRWQRDWSGTRTPGYWSKRKTQLPINAHSVRIVTFNNGSYIATREWPNDPGFGGQTSKEVWQLLMSGWYAVPAGVSTFSGAPDNQALSRLLTKMGAENANLAQDIGEVGETLRMIHKTISRVHFAHMALKQGNLPGAINALWSGRGSSSRSKRDFKLVSTWAKTAKTGAKELAENWLELQYGWKPLLSDVHDSVEKVSRYFQKSGDFIIAQASGSSSKRSTTVSDRDSVYVPGPYNANVKVRTSIDLYERTKFGLRFKVSDAQKAFLAQTGFTNPIDLAWELLPYSFVVDWFLPIGPWLESFTAFSGLEFVDGYKTQFQRENTIMSVHDSGFAPGPGYIPAWWAEDGYWDRSVVMLNRTKLTTWPASTLPHFKSPWSVGHILNGLALLAAGFQVSSRYHV